MAKATCSNTTRRAVLSAGLATTAALSLAAASAFAPAPLASELVAQIRAMAAGLYAAIKEEMAAEGTPAYPALLRRSELLQEEFDRLSESVWSMPARTWQDVAARAEIASYWAERERNGQLSALTCACPGEHSAAQLLDAVLTMSGDRQAS